MRLVLVVTKIVKHLSCEGSTSCPSVVPFVISSVAHETSTSASHPVTESVTESEIQSRRVLLRARSCQIDQVTTKLVTESWTISYVSIVISFRWLSSLEITAPCSLLDAVCESSSAVDTAYYSFRKMHLICLDLPLINQLNCSLGNYLQGSRVSDFVLELLKALIHLVSFQYKLKRQDKVALTIKATCSERIQERINFLLKLWSKIGTASGNTASVPFIASQIKKSKKMSVKATRMLGSLGHPVRVRQDVVWLWKHLSA